MLRQCNWSALEDQDAMAAALILGEKALSENSAERTTPNDNDIEGAGIVLRAAIRTASILVGTVKRLVKPVANITPEDIPAEIRYLSFWACCHGFLPRDWSRLTR